MKSELKEQWPSESESEWGRNLHSWGTSPTRIKVITFNITSCFLFCLRVLQLSNLFRAAYYLNRRNVQKKKKWKHGHTHKNSPAHLIQTAQQIIKYLGKQHRLAQGGSYVHCICLIADQAGFWEGDKPVGGQRETNCHQKIAGVPLRKASPVIIKWCLQGHIDAEFKSVPAHFMLSALLARMSCLLIYL